jgi:Predicted membrane protein (DUF2306)
MSVITRPEPTTTTAGPRRWRRWPLVSLAVVSLALLVYMLTPYIPPDMSTSRAKFDNGIFFVLLVAHIFTATVATVTGLAQFWPWLRNNHPRVHRWVGRAYFFAGVFPSMVLAVPVALAAPFGVSNQAGLLMVDLAWAGTAIAGYRSARQRRFADHRRWMIRNYALTFSSLFSRIVQPVLALIIVSQASGPSYRGDNLAIIHDIASSSIWVGVLMVVVAAEFYIQRRYGVPRLQRPALQRQP